MAGPGWAWLRLAGPAGPRRAGSDRAGFGQAGLGRAGLGAAGPGLVGSRTYPNTAGSHPKPIFSYRSGFFF